MKFVVFNRYCLAYSIQKKSLAKAETSYKTSFSAYMRTSYKFILFY